MDELSKPDDKNWHANPPPARVHALDAQALDLELDAILLGMWEGVWSKIGVRATEWLKPELAAIMRGVIWYFSMGVGCRTAGQTIQNLHVVSSAYLRPPQPLGSVLEPSGSRTPTTNLATWQRVLHGVLEVCPAILSDQLGFCIQVPRFVGGRLLS